MDIVGQLQEGLVRFSAQESRVAAFILKNLSFTASASIDELAASAGVSPATITRFARSVGCEDIRDLRKQLAQASERRASWLAPDSNALPAAWRDALSYLGSTLAQQLANTSETAVEKLKSRLREARTVHCFALGAQDTALASLLQHQLLPAGIAINLCQDASLMRMTASTLSDDHLLLVLVTAEADTVLQSATLQARTQGVTIIALTPPQHALANMAADIIPLPDSPQLARYALLLLVDLLNDTLMA
ncbi:MurR/RpiR family transcriptional regulator [Raoultella ornithinolytica]|uniref:MurR/RpiR family transcriptional regulator n=1 Tax=Raoultella ornithinolytica TaxID=54291 RepID=UPI000B4C98AE|nr:MurR/RpiR family transcriptional regulator [Raoultella ornithinolytica]EKT9523864.1 MurR/RpiR family transcriptional regulator [Raoultella ornithinolytica]EKW7116878.1 MurR/RpiR family transcriptional regulator [Raoultella ornithinolytica]ELS0867427.1 MurR/RpiR family transcriptional regulator [Raoultella ornithinolytica]MBZ7753588.1 MurR/RpiR family transcriptional regulator [Raoultella ornithinolytica]MDV1098307.1 MurR/RpiR family transcriptional regulator [Raoultella ornithinolytica]